MSFNIHLCKCLSPEKALTKDVTLIDNIEGTLRDESNLVDPVVIIQSDSATMADVNYVTIPRFHRSYFVKEIRFVRTHIYEITLHVDVLRSFADEIRTNSAIIKRNQFAHNIRVNDGVFTVTQDPHIVYRNFAGGSGYGFQQDPEFVLAIAGS